MADPNDQDWGAGDQAVPTGPAYLAAVTKAKGPGYAAMVQAVANGKMDQVKGFGLKAPELQALMQDAFLVNPNADVADAPARTAARKAFTSGKQGQNLLSIGTALDHLDFLDQAVNQLGNVQSPIPGTTTLANTVRNAYRRADGNPDVSKFEGSVPNVLDEVVKAARGTGGNEADIARLEKAFNESGSQEQQRAVIQAWAQQFHGRLQESMDSYHRAIGTTAENPPGIAPDAMNRIQRFLSPDYVSKGLAGVAPSGGTPPDAGAAPPGTPPTPGTPGGGSGGGGIPEGFTPEDIARGYRINADGSTDTPGADGKAYVRTGPHTADVPDPSKSDELGTIGTFAASGANAAAFGLLPRIGAGISAVGSRLLGDNESLSDIYDNQLAQNNARLSNGEASHPIAALGGNVAGFLADGGALGAIPGVARLAGKLPAVIRPAVGDALYGAAFGAGSSDNLADAPRGALTGGALGAVGGALGRGVARGAAGIVAPVVNASVRRLTDAGVTLTPGQIFGAGGGVVGRAVKGIEDRAAGFPIVGDVINNARLGGVEDFNRAAINRALEPIGQTASDIGHAGLADAQTKVGDAYTRALGGMRAAPDAQFSTDLQGVQRQASSLSGAKREEYSRILDTDVVPYLSGNTNIPGHDLQAIKQGLDTRISNLRGQGSTPQDRDLADTLDGLRDSFMHLARRTDPSSAAEFDKANAAYSALSRVSNAASKAKDGVFSPQQFRTAVTKRGYGTTTANLARGDAPLQDLATDASMVLPSSVPDSGTAGRAALGLLAGRLAPGAALGGLAGYESGGGHAGALTGAALGAAAFSRPGLGVTQSLLTGSRGRAFTTLGDLLRRGAPLVGTAGTTTLLQRSSK